MNRLIFGPVPLPPDDGNMMILQGAAGDEPRWLQPIVNGDAIGSR